MRDKESCSCTGGGVVTLVVGGLIGAGIALMLAPQTGKKARKYLACYAKEFGDKANDAVNEFSATLSDFVETAGSRASEILEQGADLTTDSKKTLLAALEKGQEILEKQRKKLADSIG